MQDESGVHLSVIIPAYNEERRLPGTLQGVLKYLSGQPYHSEIVVVDDGSTDRTAQVARNEAGRTPEVRLCIHPDGANHGKGASVRLGMLRGSGAYRLFMDAD